MTQEQKQELENKASFYLPNQHIYMYGAVDGYNMAYQSVLPLLEAEREKVRKLREVVGNKK